MYTVLLSSSIYLGAFYYPSYLYIGVFLWMLPLLVTDKDNTYGFNEGYVWGLLFFSGHLIWLGCIINAQGKGDARMIIYFLTVCYFSLFSGFWLWFKQLLVYRWMRKYKNQQGKMVALWCTWVISTVTFLYATCYCSLAIFDYFEGYTFINPLLPLVSWSWYVRPVCSIGTIGYWIIIVCINLTLASLVKKVDAPTLIFLMALVCFPALFQPLPQKKIDYKFIYLQPTWNDTQVTPAETFYAISRAIDRVADCCDGHCIVLPEGSFGYDLIAWENKIVAWTSLLPATTSIFVGAHRVDGNKLFNSLFQIRDGKIVAWYDKQHRMFFTERQPYVAQWMSMISDLFVREYFNVPEHDQSTACFDGLQPIICSELFSEKKRFIQDKPFLFICDDSWFYLDYAKELAKRSAKLYGLRHRQPVIYVGSYDYEIMT